MRQRSILHCDADKYYVAVEQQQNPKLRGQRVAVCGSKEDRHGIVLTASAEAKAMGVKTGQAIWEAQRCCRDLIIVPPHYDEYVRYSGYIRDILKDYTDQIESFGLDESWIDVTGSVGLFGDGMSIAKEISRRVRQEIGITVSIGVANNKVFAKLGSDYKKPNGITRIEDDNFKDVVYPLPVEDLLYVGPVTKRKLNHYCIRTIGDLAGTDPEVLHSWLGKMGYILSAFARGQDTSPVMKMEHHHTVKSVGNSGTMPRDLVNDPDAWLVIMVMAESVAARLRELNMKCTVVEVSIRDNEMNGFSRQQKISQPTNVSLEIARVAFALFKQNYHWQKPLRGIGVRGADLVPDNIPLQLNLFSDENRRQKWESIERAVDIVRGRYGYASILRAVLYTDTSLGLINPKDDHTIHPVGYFSA